MKRTLWIVTAVILAAAGMPPAAGDESRPVIEKLLRDAGAATYSCRKDYGKGIDVLCLGYGPEGESRVGIALRKTKTYRKVTAVVAVVPQDGSFRIRAAEIPDIEKLKGKSRELVKEALEDITGRVLVGEKEARSLVDAVSGATRYYKAVYVSYALMASRVIAELTAEPDWPREPVPSES
jgi:hypothetical protein